MIGVKSVVLCTVSKCFLRLEVVFQALDSVLLLGAQILQQTRMFLSLSSTTIK